MRKKFLSIVLILSMLLPLMPIMAAADTPIAQTIAEITKTETDTTYNFDVEAANTYANCYVYAAIYDVNGALLAVNRVPLEMTGNTNISIDKSVYNASAKVFIWSDDMQPIIEAEEFTLTPTATLPPRPTTTPKPTPTATPTLKPTATPIPTPTPTLKPANDFAWTFNETTGTLTISGTGAMKDYYSASNSIPWYNNQSKIKSVVIKNGITRIGEYAFWNCSNLTSVTIPNSIISIGDDAFRDCISLTTVTIPNSAISIGDRAFCDCISLTDITIGNGVTSIGDRAFSGCSSLVDVTIGNSVTSIGYSAFSNCSALTSITIPNSVTNIGDNAFGWCNNLDSVYISDLAAYLNIDGYSPMGGAKKLYLNNKRVAGEIIIPEGTKCICSAAFYGCDGITSVTIPDSVTSIGKDAFNGCSSLTDVTIGNGVTSIGSWAFRSCSDLTNVTIGNSVTSIGKDVFDWCGSFSIYYNGTVEQWCRISFNNLSSNSGININLYFNGELITDLVIPNSITSIGDWAFCDCYSITSVTIPNSVTSIGEDAFNGLIAVYYNGAVEQWCRISFSTPMYYKNLYFNNELIKDLVIPNSVTRINSYAFYSCSSLEKITIPKSVTEIESGAFKDCSKLTTVNYCGSEKEWNEMYIGSNNDYLKNANIVFDYVVE